MKKLLFMAVALFFAGSAAIAQQAPKSPRKTAEGKDVSISYGAPSKRDRTIFGGLVPYDEVWRTGADKGTELTLKKDGKVGNVDVKAGTYTLFTIPKANGNWTVILNPTLDQWGSFRYDLIKAADLPHISVKAQKTKSVVEELNIAFVGSDLVISWDDTQVKVPVKIK
jgi:hypothetical protein